MSITLIRDDDKNKKPPPFKISKPAEATPVKFWKNEGDQNLSVLAFDKEGKGADFSETLTGIMGVKDIDLANNIFVEGATAIQCFSNSEADKFNIIAQTLHDLQPKDAIEAKLVVQASVLFSHGLHNLKRSENAERFDASNHYGNLAIKLIRLHNETIETLSRYRRGGEQKVTVQHVNVNDGGKAIIGNVSGVGETNKNGGTTLCSVSAELNPNQTTICPADNPQWPMDAAVYMAEKAPAQKRKKGKKG